MQLVHAPFFLPNPSIYSPCSLSNLWPFKISYMLCYSLLDNLKCERNKKTMSLSYILYHAFAKMNII